MNHLNEKPSQQTTTKKTIKYHTTHYKKIIELRHDMRDIHDDINVILDVVANLCERIEKLEGRRL